MTRDNTAARSAVAGKLSHIPVRPSGHSAPIKMTGKNSAVDTDINEAATGFSTASTRLEQTKENHLVTYVILKRYSALTARAVVCAPASAMNSPVISSGKRVMAAAEASETTPLATKQHFLDGPHP